MSIRDLLRNALRMRPDRIVVGEVRGPEALDMLQAMNTGHDGSLSTVHCNSPRDAISRIETMVLMAGFDLPVRAIREQVASALHLIVHTERLHDGSRKVVRITEVQRMEGDQVTLQDLFVFNVHGSTANGSIAGALESTGLHPSFKDDFHRRGIALPADLFAHAMRRRPYHSRCSCSGSPVRDNGRAATGTLRLSLSPGATFPQRQFTLDLPTPASSLQPARHRERRARHPRTSRRSRRTCPYQHRGPPRHEQQHARPGAPLRPRLLQTLIAQKPARSEAAVFGFAGPPIWSTHGRRRRRLTRPGIDRPVSRDRALGCGRHGEPERGRAQRRPRGRSCFSQTAPTPTSAATVQMPPTPHSASTPACSSSASRCASSNRATCSGSSTADRRQVHPGALVRPAPPGICRARDRLGRQYLLTYTSQLRGTGHPVVVDLVGRRPPASSTTRSRR